MTNKTYSKKYISAAVGLAAIASLALAIPAMADTTPAPATATSATHKAGAWMGGMRGGQMHPGAFGKVTAINGNTITISSEQFTKPTTAGTAPTGTAVTYTIDATNATVTKANAASTVSAIAVGDMIAVQGTVTGTNVVATTIRDGVMMGMGRGGVGKATSTPPTPVIAGNGEPVVAGKISAVSGDTVTITNASNVTYTVDVTNAKIAQGNTLASLSALSVGDSVVVQGTVNGNAITAYSVTDTKAPTNTTGTAAKGNGGFLGSIKNFFSHLFGF